jgi:hypothetical protein
MRAVLPETTCTQSQGADDSGFVIDGEKTFALGAHAAGEDRSHRSVHTGPADCRKSQLPVRKPVETGARGHALRRDLPRVPRSADRMRRHARSGARDRRGSTTMAPPNDWALSGMWSAIPVSGDLHCAIESSFCGEGVVVGGRVVSATPTTAMLGCSSCVHLPAIPCHHAWG